MRALINRRRCFGLLAGALVSLGGLRQNAQATMPLDTIICWNSGGAFCAGGVLYQQQCCKDCYGTICDSLGCDDVVVGSC